MLGLCLRDIVHCNQLLISNITSRYQTNHSILVMMWAQYQLYDLKQKTADL